MAEVLVLRIEGVWQSWGERSKWEYRDTASMPTKSGIIGILSCAAGYPRGDKRIYELDQALYLTIRADRAGTETVDYQTVYSRHMKTARGTLKKMAGSKKGEYTLVLHKSYLEDACFTVIIGQKDGGSEVLQSLEQVMRHPVWPPYLGRKSCVPSIPLIPTLISVRDTEKAAYEIPLAERSDEWIWMEQDVPYSQKTLIRSDVDGQNRRFWNRNVSRQRVPKGVIEAYVSQQNRTAEA